MSAIRLSELGFEVPQPGWSGRGRALALVAAKVVGIVLLVLGVLAAVEIGIVVLWASQL